ncbi:hypothetical protein V6Z11_D01G238100 [Gossypium hirsutum]
MCAFTSAVPVFLDNVLPSYGSSITMSADRSVLRPLVQSSTARDIQLDPSVSATWFVDSEATHHVTLRLFLLGRSMLVKAKLSLSLLLINFAHISSPNCIKPLSVY